MRDQLSREEIEELRQENPQRLFQHLAEVERDFLFGVEDHRDDPDGWGGELRVTINRNVVVHFVPTLNQAMERRKELPQFCVFPDEARADSTAETKVELEDGDEVRGVVFYVDPQDYDRLVGDGLRVVEDYGALDIIPDTYFLDSELIEFLHRVVLAHPLVAAERDYDFRLGLVGGEPSPLLDDEEQPEPELPTPILEDEEDGEAPPASEEDDEEAGPDEEDDLDDEGPRHFRSLRL